MKNLKTAVHERGFVLLVVYVVVIFVSLFSAVFFVRHQIAIQSTERYQNRVLAFNAAESGIDFALRELATDAAMRSTPPENAAESDPPYYTSPVFPMSQNAFRVKLSFVPEKPMFRRIDAEGYAPNNDTTARAYQTSKITVYAQITEPAPPGSLFEYGIYAKQSIDLSGDKTCAFDSYNSNQGAYGGSNVSGEGAIAADTIAVDKILLKNTTVNGSVLVGDDGNPSAVIDLKKATITGETTTLADDWELPDLPPLPETHTNIDLSNISGSTVITLAPGTYHCTSLKTTGNAKIVTTGAVKIYVDGNIDLEGNGITVPNNHPGNLYLFATGSVNVKIAGNGSFYGGVFAPNSDVVADGNGDIFGAVVSNTFTSVGNGAVHFDLAMKEAQPVDPNQMHIVRVRAWQELNSLAWGTGASV